MNYRTVFESSYDRRAWQNLLHDIFRGKATFFANPPSLTLNGDIAKEAFYIGKITLAEGDELALYEVELGEKVNIKRNRRGVHLLLDADYARRGQTGAFILSYRKGETDVRFSYSGVTWGFNERGDYEKKTTDTKRFTYLLGEGRACRTAAERFATLKESALTLDDVTAAFSVEALTRRFYKELFDWYQWAVSEEGGVTFPNNVTTEDDDRDDLETKVIRMITRVMFIWFVKQKDLVPARLFNADFVAEVLKDFDPLSPVEGNYYNAILQNLFFATLNRAITDEKSGTRRFATAEKTDVKTLYRYAELFSISKEEVVKMFAEVPFFNGGLFECLDKTRYHDGVDRSFNFDGFSRNDARFSDGRYKNRAVVPNVLFFEPEKGLLSILSRYNFTVEENTPEDQQVALDPELLGKVFENLLGAYNPETRATARNQSGSFYTPREIVHYMVDESLIAYLGDTPLVRALFARDFTYDETQREEYDWIAERLKSVKVLDPACGSGAFPMGLLKRMVDVLERINPEASSYELKLSIIEHCLYGSDIQSIAAQITKLRFFISLICDCEKDITKANFGIPTLPNLETKFVAADSLVAKKKTAEQGCLFVDPEIEPTKEKLQEVRHRHFSARSAAEKHRLRLKDAELRKKLAALLEDNRDYAPEDAKQLASWNPYDQNAVSPFFDPEWMFGLSEGFDIVIGNPPYVQLQGDGGRLADRYAPCGYETLARTGDLYGLFYERGYGLLRPGGLLCFITSNKWMRAGYGEKLRAFFARRTDPRLLIDFAGVKIFESATVDTNILLFAKSANLGHTVASVADRLEKKDVGRLADYVRDNHVLTAFTASDSWVILSPIEQSIKQKIEAVGTPLKDWDINIYRGVLTGYNDAFIISTEKRDEILANCLTEDERTRTAELIRPILRGRDIKRYGYEWAEKYLIATFPSRHYDIEQYPAVKQHLLSFGKERLEQTGKTYTIDGEKIKARKKTSNKWFETQDSISYWEDFNKPKIIWKRIGSILRFSYDVNEHFGLDSTCFVTGQHMAYLCCVLNSIMGHYMFKDSPKTGTGDLLVSVQAIEPIIIPLNKEIEKLFEKLLVEVLEQDSTKAKKEINRLAFKLYDLSPEEIAYITDFVTQSQQSQ